MPYDIKKIRKVKHRERDETYYCRMCDFSGNGSTGTAIKEAKKHCRKTLHTVDVYKEVWEEITCFSKTHH